ncbi:E2-like conjugating enzyme atg10 [Clonorchis sinensis]|uniref:Ubiquitin-like-conjugating enzyme ATG10 n=1 Tax=Clonorchis sinensis TaxID=79923 RepID=A0A8T1MAF1_CLOSI|nr:E2-like conjugating enzyme atg10 [Clonorchis sinensis]
MNNGRLPQSDFLKAIKTVFSHLQHRTDVCSQWSIEELVNPVSVELVCRQYFPATECLSAEGNIVVEYRILYSDAYEVPVLLFRCQDADGYPLSSYLVPQLGGDNNFATTNLLAGVSQIEHAHFGTPYFQFHPCKTAEMMHQALGRMHSNNVEYAVQYLLAWLSSVGSPLGLLLPQDLATIVCVESVDAI